jgi:hypothetical protein
MHQPKPGPSACCQNQRTEPIYAESLCKAEVGIVSVAAFILFQEIRHAAKHTSLAKAQVQTLQLYLIKIGTELTESVRRVVLHLPCSFPHRQALREIAKALGCIT